MDLLAANFENDFDESSDEEEIMHLNGRAPRTVNANRNYKYFEIPYCSLQFQERVFNEDISGQVYKERYRCSSSVVDRIELMIGEIIKKPTRRNRPLTPRQEVTNLL